MVLYFSGTGNSAHAARKIAESLGDEALNLFEKIRNSDHAPLHSERPWVVAAPTYAWRLPHIVENFLAKTPLNGSREIYFVLTCGGSEGNAGAYLKKLCAAKGLNYRGCFGVVMPENYVAMFPVPDQVTAQVIVRRAGRRLDQASQLIRQGENFPEKKLSAMDRLNSSLVNQVFYPVFVHAKAFYAKDSCIACGKCAQVCPLNNIRLENGRPVWGKDCTHCMACICRCPVEAIEYGKKSAGKPRYTCPE